MQAFRGGRQQQSYPAGCLWATSTLAWQDNPKGSVVGITNSYLIGLKKSLRHCQNSQPLNTQLGHRSRCTVVCPVCYPPSYVPFCYPQSHQLKPWWGYRGSSSEDDNKLPNVAACDFIKVVLKEWQAGLWRLRLMDIKEGKSCPKNENIGLKINLSASTWGLEFRPLEPM